MRLATIFLAATAAAAPAQLEPRNYVLHEKRSSPRQLARRLEPHTILPMRIGLKANKEARQSAEKWLISVSHPQSTEYGKHWTTEEVVAAFSPSEETVEAVSVWLIQTGGIAKERMSLTDNKAWLAFDATVEEAERLLQTEYSELDDGEKRTVGCDKYHLPSHLLEHVDYVTPGVKGVHFKGSK